jgi:NAD(P)-dependent dehydrogenase (short-subunit alcohol dehydrogenase family)
MGRLDGKVAIVTGAGRGVGRGIAKAFAKEGAAIAIAEITESGGRAAAAELEALGARALFVHTDVAQRAQVDACVQAVLARFGHIDILVNNAARAPGRLVPFVEHDDATFALCMDALRGTVYCMQAVYPHLPKPGGRVINLGSAAGYEGNAGQAAYAAAKEAIRAVSRSAAREWGAQGITVNVICPFANSPGWLAFAEQNPKFAEGVARGRPVPRVGDCEEDIGRAALFFATADSSYVTGHTLAVDGGAAMLR